MYEHMNNVFSKKKFLTAVLLVAVSTCFSQQSDPVWPVKNAGFLQGFELQVAGESLDFLPGLTNGQVALLTRANGSSLEFQSSVVPGNYNEPYVSLVWSAAISKKLQERPASFRMYINNKEYFTFFTHEDSLSANWAIKSGDADLTFVTTEITKPSLDAFGYMFLNIPTTEIRKGERISIKVEGGNQNSMDWYMPFGIPVTNEQHVLAEPALVRTSDGLRQRVRVEIKHAGKPTTIQLKLGDKIIERSHLTPGKRIFYLMHEAVNESKQVNLEIAIAGTSATMHRVVLNPIRKFEVYFLPHSHVDIGFTHKQADVEKLQWENLELAIDLAERTKNYPEGSRFKWNVEGTWAIEGYLKNASGEKKQRFLDAVEKGWIGLDALYASQLTGLQREEEMINNQRFAGKLSDQYGFNITTAMISDVPGYSWGMVESLAQTGVKYLSSGPNHMPHLPHGGYQVGHTLETWGDVPFYWTSASGKQKILFWMTSHGYSWFHSWSIDLLSKAGGDPVLKFLYELEKQKYPYDIVQLRYTIGNDNGPPDVTMPDFIKEWNGTYAYPKMRIATNREMMEAFEKRYGDKLPVYGGDFTPYWEDGAASSALETGINRKTADRLVQAETLSAMIGSPKDASARFDDAWRNVVLFSEHTWGANISKSQPESEFTKALWDVKQNFAINGQKQAEALIQDALESIASEGTEVEAFQILNTTSWTRSNLVTLPANWNLKEIRITDENGEKIETQILSNGSVAFVAKNVPALSSRRYYIRKAKKKERVKALSEAYQLSSGNIKISFNQKTGDIASIRFKGGPNLVNERDTLGFNAYWYGGLIKSNLQKQNNDPTFEVMENGKVLTKIRITSSAPGAESLIREVQLVNGLDEIYLTNVVDKKKVLKDENVRFSFPFDIPDGQVRIDIPWATVKPEGDQLKGANKNFYSVQRWVDMSNQNMGITLATLEAPLLEIGDMNGQQWMTDMAVRPWIKEYIPSETLFSWVMNNAWFVNYKAWQAGKIPFHYVLRPHAAFDDFKTKKFGIEQTQPLLAVPVAKDSEIIKPVLTLKDASNIIITSIKSSLDKKALIIRFFNPTDEAGKAAITWGRFKPASLYISSAREQQVSPTGNTISLEPWQVQTLRVELP